MNYFLLNISKDFFISFTQIMLGQDDKIKQKYYSYTYLED